MRSHQEWYLTPRDFIKRDLNKSISSDFRDLVRIVVVVKPMRSDSGPGVATVGIYVENHGSLNFENSLFVYDLTI